MKASEIITLLQRAIVEKGDVDVELIAQYGGKSYCFEPAFAPTTSIDGRVIPNTEHNPNVSDFGSDPETIAIWTDICTG